jgi:hypothetical protein
MANATERAEIREAMLCIIGAIKAIQAGSEDDFVYDMVRQAEQAIDRAFSDETC